MTADGCLSSPGLVPLSIRCGKMKDRLVPTPLDSRPRIKSQSEVEPSEYTRPRRCEMEPTGLHNDIVCRAQPAHDLVGSRDKCTRLGLSDILQLTVTPEIRLPPPPCRKVFPTA